MVAFYHRALASLYIALWLLSVVNAGETDPQFYGVDKVMHEHSMRFYQPTEFATSSSANPYGVYPDKNLQFFKNRDQDLTHTLHEDAVHDSGVLLVGTHKSWALGRKQTYYLSMIRPDTNLGERFGLNRADLRSPNGKVAFAFWRHKGAEIRLLDECTIPHTGAGYDIKHLGNLIPLGEVRAVVRAEESPRSLCTASYQRQMLGSERLVCAVASLRLMHLSWLSIPHAACRLNDTVSTFEN